MLSNLILSIVCCTATLYRYFVKLLRLVNCCIIYLRQRRKYMRLPAMFFCLCARLLKNACMDLDEILRVDRCRDMDELINFSVRPGS